MNSGIRPNLMEILGHRIGEVIRGVDLGLRAHLGTEAQAALSATRS